jgi:uncharacterized protein YcbX
MVRSLGRYPVKSMRGEEPAEVDFHSRGVVGDRAYALLDQETGAILSMKHPRRLGRLLECQAAFRRPPAPGGPLPPVAVTFPDGRVLGSEDTGLVSALSRFLEREVALITSAPVGAAAETYWPDIEGLLYRNQTRPSRLGLAVPGALYDLAPVHVLSTATLAHLSSLYPDGRFDAARFRPNLLVASARDEAAFEENDWIGRTLAVGDEVELRIVDPCPRCVATTLAQGDLPADSGILRTIAQHNAVPSHTFAPGVVFRASAGVYATVVRSGRVRVGDAVRLI